MTAEPAPKQSKHERCQFANLNHEFLKSFEILVEISPFTPDPDPDYDDLLDPLWAEEVDRWEVEP